MDYLGIIKRAYDITLKHKYLWIFGLLAGGAAGASNFNLSLPSGTNNGSYYKWTDNITSPKIEEFLTGYWGVIIAIVGVILILFLVIFVLSIIFQGALLGSVRSIDEKEKNNLRLGFIFGWHNFWRVFAVSLIIFLIVILSLILLGLPIFLFVIAKAYVFAVIYGILTFLICLVLWLYLGLLQPYILREIVLSETGIWESFSKSWDFFRRHWREILIMYLLVLAIGIVIAIVYVLGLLLIGGLLFAIGLAIYLVSKIACIIYAVIAIAGLFILLCLVRGAINTFLSSIFTLTYLELEKKKP